MRQSKVHKISEYLLGWFSIHGRQFPWRQTRNPYSILLAEKLLQQTSVRPGLVQAYQELLSLYPTPMALAAADLDEVSTIIQSLGLRYRAQELITLAQAICEEHDGCVPQNFKSLMALPGIGDYTSRAILCFAFNQDVPIVDTNVARILYRVFGLPGPMPANPARKRSLIELAGSLIPSGRARDFNLAMLDLGALVCKSSNPKCQICPLLTVCEFGSTVVNEN